MTELSLKTKCIHAGQAVSDSPSQARAVPLYLTSSYLFRDVAHARSLFDLEQEGHIYSRLSNPTTEVFEARLAALEGGLGAVAFSSGMAAITASLINIVEPGAEIVASKHLYGGTYQLFTRTMPDTYGVNVAFADPTDAQNFEKQINERTRVLYVESVGNPTLTIPDFQGLAALAAEHKIPLFVDNTFPTPYLFRPIEWGATIVIHSSTKWIGGHGLAIGGVVLDSGKFDWAASSKFKKLWTKDKRFLPDSSYVAKFGEAAYLTKLRAHILKDTGGCPSPLNSWLFLLGLETLHVRMERHIQNTLSIAEYLHKHPAVAWIDNPSLPWSTHHPKAKTYMPDGSTAIISFGLKNGSEGAVKLVNKVRLISHLANVGDAKTLILHPASTTHRLSARELQRLDLDTTYIRLSVGIEDVADIIADLDQALSSSQG